MSEKTEGPFSLCLSFLAVAMMVIEFGNIVRGGEPSLRTRGMIAPCNVNMVRHPRGSYIVIVIVISISLLSLGWPHQKTN